MRRALAFGSLTLALLACGDDAAVEVGADSTTSSQVESTTSTTATTTSTTVAPTTSTTTTVPPAVETAPSTTQLECGAPGSATDLRDEPDYSADYLHRWTVGAECPVRLDVLMTRRPPPDFHCEGWPPDLVMGTPLGARTPDTTTRIYVRDPDGYFGDPTLQAGFASLEGPPAGADDTGYRQDGVELWMDPSDDGFVYLVAADGTERWPKQTQTFGCA